MKTSWTLCAAILFALPALALASAPDSLAAPGPSGASWIPPARKFWLEPQSEGGWLAPDKRLHASLSFSAAVGLRAAGASAKASLLGAAALGLAKEAHDCLLRRPGPAQGVSRRDLLADAAGILAAALMLHLAMR